MGEPRRTTRFGALAALCITGVLIATGCASSEAPPPPTTASSSPTAEKSDAAVLAAVLDVYTRYSAALDAILARGDGDYSQLESLTTPEFFDRLSDGGTFGTNGWVTTGSTSFDSEELTRDTDLSVTIRLCRDVSRVRVIDRSGKDVTPDDRTERFVVAVTFLKANSEADYLIDSSERDVEDVSCED